MKRFAWAATVIATVILTETTRVRGQEKKTYDVVVYGGTSSGVVAAVKTAQMGKSVILIEPGKHVGGLTSGGLGATDIGNKAAIGGMSREFYRRLGKHYGKDEMWTFEPHVAEELFQESLKDAKVPVVKGQRLDLKDGVKKEGNRVISIKMESGETYAGKIFIDATYEGDLMAKAGVDYRVGREASAEFDEPLNGVQKPSLAHQFKNPVDAYVTPGDPSSGLLPGIHPGGPGTPGEGDKRVQAYNFRICMTDVKDNQIPFPKPVGYDPMRYELLLRYLKTGVFDVIGNSQRMPNGKTDTNNNGGFSSDNIGMNYDFPDGDYATRDKIFQDHVTYHQGMLWFLVNDPRVPENVRAFMGKWGLCKDEFQDTGGWGHQLYVREARRMRGEYVMTQHNCQGKTAAADPVGLAAYGMDSHNTQRFADEAGHAKNEGDVQVHGFHPYPIAYKCLVPREVQCANLLVPVCLSATHIAYGSIRMEPVFMVLGQSAATAACDAIDQNVSVQKIDYAKLHAQLLADNQVLEWTGPPATGTGAGGGIDPAKLPGVVVDDSQAQLRGKWNQGNTTGRFVGAGYRHDGNENKGEASAIFEIPIAREGDYEIRLAYSALANRASNVPITIRGFAGDGQKSITLNQKQAPPIDRLFASLGNFHFEAGATASVEISNTGTDGHVIIDAVQVIRAEQDK